MQLRGAVEHAAHLYAEEVRGAMTVSMRVMSAGEGYRYLLKGVVTGDRDRRDPNPLVDYYASDGNPPGRWLGSGLHAFGGGEIKQWDEVTPQQLALLLGMGRDPVTGDQLGRAFPEYATVSARVAKRVAELGPQLSGEQREAAVAQINAEEVASGHQRAVAGFDFTFSVPKSLSALWGVADAGTQALIVEAHHAALSEVLGFLEREVATTRRGVKAVDGAVAQADVVGIAATVYDHWDSRLGDPQLHTHVVISNKVKTVGDGRWRTLDGRPMHAAVVAISEHYNAVLADRITRTFGIGWEQRERGKERNQAWELAPVPEALIQEFSGRSRAIEEQKDRLIEDYIAQHGRRPSSTTVILLRARATLSTRPEKQIRSLTDLTGEWRGRAQKILGMGATDWARNLTAGLGSRPGLRADDVSLDVIGVLGVSVVGAVSEKRATWSHWNLWAETSRQTMGWRFASTGDREAVVAMIVDAAKRDSLPLTPPELAASPEPFQRGDGTTVFRPRHGVVFTSQELLAAENRLLRRSSTLGAPVVGADAIERAAAREHRLSTEQTQTLAHVAESGRQLDLLVGPAGSGKTTAMHTLKVAWTKVYGHDSVVGLAPSAAAAQVLAEDLGIECENTAKWLHEFNRGRAQFRPGQLVIIDEATLSGTLALDSLTALAADAGAKVLLVGDWAQLQAVDAGGAFTLLASARPDTPELGEIRRFTNHWEKAATLDLRHGRTEVIDTYLLHKRIREGTTDQMIDAAYLAWAADARAGCSTILVAEASETVTYLNTRARAERIVQGDTTGSSEVNLADGTQASVRDFIITRRNDRGLRPPRGGWVRNGDRWRVTHVGKDGSMDVERLDGAVGGSVTLPASYVAEHVDLGYAVTAHRAQGITVATSHVVVSGTTTRENFYVSMTRGRDSNIAYVALDKPNEGHTPPEPDDVTAGTVLYGVLRHCGAELSAHQMIESEQERWSSIAQIAAEYETIAAVAQRHRWIALVQACGLTDEQVDLVLASESFGPLTAELRRAEADQHDVDGLLPGLVARRPLDDADDIGAVLISRLRKAAPARQGKLRAEPNLVAGLIPVADGPMAPEMATALTERQVFLESRASVLAENAVRAKELWLTRLGTPPTGSELRRWLREVRTVVAYRDRYQVVGHSVLGEPRTEAQRLAAGRAARAIRRARQISEDTAGRDERMRALRDGTRVIG